MSCPLDEGRSKRGFVSTKGLPEKAAVSAYTINTCPGPEHSLRAQGCRRTQSGEGAPQKLRCHNARASGGPELLVVLPQAPSDSPGPVSHSWS